MPETIFEKMCLALAYNSCVLVAARVTQAVSLSSTCSVPRISRHAACRGAAACAIIVPFEYSIQTGPDMVLRSWRHAEGISSILPAAVTAFQMTCATASVLEPASVQSSLLASVVTVLLAATSNAVSR